MTMRFGQPALYGALLTFAIGQAAASAAVECPLRLGSVRAESGASASTGRSLVNGLTMALKEINAHGGIAGCQVEVVSYDSQSVPATAATLTRRLVAQDGVPLVIGSSLSVESLAMMEVTDNAEIPLYVPSAASAKITSQGSQWVWRQSVIDSISAAALVSYITKDLGWKKIAIAYENSDLARPAFQNVLKPGIAAAGAMVVDTEAIDPGDNDVSSPLLRVRDSGADGLVFWGYLKEGALLTRQNQELKLNLKLAGGTGLVYPEYLRLLTPEVQNPTTLYAVTQFNWNTDDPKQRAWVDAFKKQFGTDADVTSIDAYDAAYILKTAIEAAQSTDPNALQKALRAVHYQGIGGSISFDASGQALRDVSIVKLTPKNGVGFQTVKTIEGK